MRKHLSFRSINAANHGCRFARAISLTLCLTRFLSSNLDISNILLVLQRSSKRNFVFIGQLTVFYEPIQCSCSRTRQIECALKNVSLKTHAQVFCTTGFDSRSKNSDRRTNTMQKQKRRKTPGDGILLSLNVPLAKFSRCRSKKSLAARDKAVWSWE